MPSFMDALSRQLAALRTPGGGQDVLNRRPQMKPMRGYVGGDDTDPGLYVGNGWNNPYDQAKRADVMARAEPEHGDATFKAETERGAMQQLGGTLQRKGGRMTSEDRKQILAVLTKIGKPPTPNQLLDDPNADQEDALERIRATGEQNRQTDAAQTTSRSQPGGASPYVQERRTRTRDSVDELMGKVSRWTTGVGTLTAGFPETPARNFQAELETLKANIGFSELTEMREASKTGGALGQVSDREISLLTSTLGALDAGQSPENLKTQLQKIKDSLDRWEMAQAGTAGTAPADVPAQNASGGTQRWGRDASGRPVRMP